MHAANKALAQSLPMFECAQAMPVMVDLEARMRLMDGFPGYEQVISLASPPVEAFTVPNETPGLARIGNEAQAAWCQTYPDRLRGFIATLPMNHPNALLEEARFACEELGALGVQVYTNVNGQPLDKGEFLALFELMATLDKPVWLHPLRTSTAPDYPGESDSKYDLWWALGWPYETSVCMGRLVFAGVFDRWPQLKIITHHAGGMVPMMEGRLGSGMDLMAKRYPPADPSAAQPKLQQDLVRSFRQFYADTATFGSRAAIECAAAFFGHERMLFATDMPFDPECGPGNIRDTLRAIEATDWSPKQRQRVLRGNALRLLGLSA